MNIAVSNIE